jgi:hypothetical protein
MDRGRNFGLLLGPVSGVIDVEYDDADGERYAKEMGLDKIPTPTYRSKRSVHRLFKFDAGAFPKIAVKKACGLEIRIGGGDRGAQSVMPPSTHSSGEVYTWLRDMSPEDVEPAEAPEWLVAMCFTGEGPLPAGPRAPVQRLQHKKPTGKAAAASGRRPIMEVISEGVSEGGRNDALYRLAVKIGMGLNDLDDAKEEQTFLSQLRGANKAFFKPPLDDSEVLSVYRSAAAYCRKARAAGATSDEPEGYSGGEAGISDEQRGDDLSPMTKWGLAYHPVGDNNFAEYWPGDWKLTVVHSDPIEYRLEVPSWAALTSNGRGIVALKLEEFTTSHKMAAKVLECTGRVMLDARPAEWSAIWDGMAPKRDRPAVTGLKAKLLEVADDEWPSDSTNLRYVTLAQWLLDVLSVPRHIAEPDEPDANGRPRWRGDGLLWLGWAQVWEDIARQRKVHDGELKTFRRRFLEILGRSRFEEARFQFPNGPKKRYITLTPADLAVLEQIASDVTIDPRSRGSVVAPLSSVVASQEPLAAPVAAFQVGDASGTILTVGGLSSAPPSGAGQEEPSGS